MHGAGFQSRAQIRARHAKVYVNAVLRAPIHSYILNLKVAAPPRGPTLVCCLCCVICPFPCPLFRLCDVFLLLTGPDPCVYSILCVSLPVALCCVCFVLLECVSISLAPYCMCLAFFLLWVVCLGLLFLYPCALPSPLPPCCACFVFSYGSLASALALYQSCAVHTRCPLVVSDFRFLMCRCAHPVPQPKHYSRSTGSPKLSYSCSENNESEGWPG